MVVVDAFSDPIDVFQELLGKPRLSNAAVADDRHEPRLAFTPGGVKLILEDPEFVVASDEGSLDEVRVGAAALVGDDSRGFERSDRFFLAFDLVFASFDDLDSTGNEFAS